MQSRQHLTLAIAIITFFLSINTGLAQKIHGDFIKEDHYSRAITLNQTHNYSLLLKKGEYAHLTLDQFGIDLTVTTTDPDGNMIELFDTPNGKNGPELILIDAIQNGIYQIEVKPLGEKKKPKQGRYILTRNSISSDPIAHLDGVLNKLQRRKTIPGFGVSILDSNQVLFNQGYGYANLEINLPYTTRTIQGIASISKTLIAISILQLVEQGKLDLDSPLNDILPFDLINPYFPKEPITIRQLMQHSSSINYTKFYSKSYIADPQIELDKKAFHKQDYRDFKLAQANENMSMRIFLEQVFSVDGKWYDKNNFIKQKPGSAFQYTNEGACLAALIVEIVSGESFAQYTENHIIKPLGLKHTGWDLERFDTTLHSEKYGINKNPIPPATGILYPDGGLYTNSEDLSLYLMEIINGLNGKGKLLNQSSYQAIAKNAKIDKKKSSGLFLEFLRDGRFGHNGGDIGVLASMFYAPTSKKGIIIMANRSYDDGPCIHTYRDAWRVIHRYAAYVKN